MVRSSEYECRVVSIPEHFVGLTEQEATDQFLFHRFLDFRTKVFTENKGWKVWLSNNTDLDQYDQYDARYIVAYEPETFTVLGGARLLRADRGNGQIGKLGSSYMIRDAYLGRLAGLPQEMASEEPPTDSQTWELTRLLTDGSPGVAEAILRAANDFLEDQGATRCLFLGSPAFMRMAKKMGYTTTPLGKITGNRDGRFLAFATNVLPSKKKSSPRRSTDNLIYLNRTK